MTPRTDLMARSPTCCWLLFGSGQAGGRTAALHDKAAENRPDADAGECRQPLVEHEVLSAVATTGSASISVVTGAAGRTASPRTNSRQARSVVTSAAPLAATTPEAFAANHEVQHLMHLTDKDVVQSLAAATAAW